MNAAFSEDEKAKILTITVYPDKESTGNATQDRIFLLSCAEVEEYFGSNSETKCKATDYAVEKGAYVKEGTGNCRWWLRTSGAKPGYAAYVDERGKTFLSDVNADSSAIRPAMWIEVNP